MTNRFQKTDSLAFLKRLKNKTVNLVLTDPPYIISKKTGFGSVVNGVERFAVNTDFGEWDKDPNFNLSDLEKSINEYYRVLVSGGTAIVFCDIWDTHGHVLIVLMETPLINA